LARAAPCSLASRRCYQPHAFLRDEDCRMAMLTLLLGLSEVNFDRLFTQRYRMHIGTRTAVACDGYVHGCR